MHENVLVCNFLSNLCAVNTVPLPLAGSNNHLPRRCLTRWIDLFVPQPGGGSYSVPAVPIDTRLASSVKRKSSGLKTEYYPPAVRVMPRVSRKSHQSNILRSFWPGETRDPDDIFFSLFFCVLSSPPWLIKTWKPSAATTWWNWESNSMPHSVDWFTPRVSTTRIASVFGKPHIYKVYFLRSKKSHARRKM